MAGRALRPRGSVDRTVLCDLPGQVVCAVLLHAKMLLRSCGIVAVSFLPTYNCQREQGSRIFTSSAQDDAAVGARVRIAWTVATLAAPCFWSAGKRLLLGASATASAGVR